MKRILAFGFTLVAATLCAAQTVVLKDPAHQANLIYERATQDGNILITETWMIGRTSRIVKSTYSDRNAPRANGCCHARDRHPEDGRDDQPARGKRLLDRTIRSRAYEHDRTQQPHVDRRSLGALVCV